jgi:hypothetical protein
VNAAGIIDSGARIGRPIATHEEESFIVRCNARARLAGTFARIVRTLCSTFSRAVSITVRWLSHAQ